MNKVFQEVVVRSSAVALADSSCSTWPSEETHNAHDDELFTYLGGTSGPIIRSVSMRIHDFRFGLWAELVRANVWLVPPGRAVVCQKGLRPEQANSVRLADVAHDDVLLGEVLSAAISEVGRDERVRRMRLRAPGDVLVASSRNGWRNGYGTDPVTGYWAGRLVAYTAVRFVDGVAAVVPLSSSFVALAVEVIPDTACGKIEVMQRVIDDHSPLGDIRSDYAFEGEVCHKCAAAIDPAWYAHMGYRRSDLAHKKVCDLCFAERFEGDPVRESAVEEDEEEDE